MVTLILLLFMLVVAVSLVAFAMASPGRLLEYVTLTGLVAGALAVAFCLNDTPGVRARLCSVGGRWVSATEDTATTATVAGQTVTVTSTRDAAVRLLRDTIGEL